MDSYFMAWRRFAEFGGRSTRTEYWMFALINFLVLIALALIGVVGIETSKDIGAVLIFPAFIYVFAMIIPGLSLAVRRLHDSGKSGWLLLLLIPLSAVPIVGPLLNIVIMCQASDPGLNQYGPNPKFPLGFGMAAGYLAPVVFGQQPPPSMTFAAQNRALFCKNCGTSFQNDSTFCTRCGTHV